MDNLSGSVEQLKGSFETAMIIIGNYFIPIVRRIVDAINAVINVFLGLPPGVQKAIAVLMGLGAGMTFLFGVIIKLGFILVPLLAKFLGFRVLQSLWGIVATFGSTLMRTGSLAAASGAMVGKASVFFAKFRLVLMRVIGASKLMGAAWALITGPVGIVIGVLAALVAIGVLLYKKWTPFRNLVNSIAAVLADFFAPAVEAVVGAWDRFVAGLLRGEGPINGISGIFNTLGLGLRAVVKAFQDGDVTSDGFVGAMEKIGVLALTVWNAVKKLGDVFMTTVVPALKEAGGGIVQALISAWKSLQPALMAVWDAFVQLGGVFRDTVLPALVKLAAFLWPIIKVVGIVAGVIIGVLFIALYKLALFLISTVLPAFIKINAFLLGTLIKVLAKVASWILTYLIVPFIKFVGILIGTVIPAIVQFAVGAAKMFWNFVTTVATIFAKIVEIITWPFRTILSIVIPIVTFFMQAIFAIFKAGFGLVMAIVELWWSVVSGLFQIGVAIVMGALKALWNGAVAVWTAIWAGIEPIVTMLWNFIKSTFEKLKNLTAVVWAAIKLLVINPIREMVSDASSKLGSMWSTVSAIFSQISGFIGSKIAEARDKVRSAIDAIKSFFSGASGMLTSAGRDIVQGLINGITGKIGELTRKVESMAKAVKDKVASVLKIFSPSRVMMGMGRNITEGLAIGVTDQEAMLTKAAEKIGNGLINTIGEYQKRIPTISMPASLGLSRLPNNGSDDEGGSGPRPPINFEYKVYNPVAEPTSVTTAKTSTRLAQLGVLS